MADIFLSYAREDGDRAAVVTRVLGNLGWSVFWDTRIIAGTSWDEVIERELTSCRCVVVLWSAAAITSNWVKIEARVGLRRNVLVPATLDSSEPPLEFGFLESAQLHGWSGNIDDPEFSALIAGIERHLKPAGRELNGESSVTATAEPERNTGLVDPAPTSRAVVHGARPETPTLSSTEPDTRRPSGRQAPQPFPVWAPAAGFALVVLTLFFMMWLVFVDRDVRCGQRTAVVLIMALTAAGAAGFSGGSATARGKLPFFKDSPLAIAASGAVGTLVIVLVLGFKLYASENCTEAPAEPAASHPSSSPLQPAAPAPQPSQSPAPAQTSVDGGPSTEFRIKTQKELFSIPSEEREKAENNQIPLDQTGDGCQFIFFDQRPLENAKGKPDRARVSITCQLPYAHAEWDGQSDHHVMTLKGCQPGLQRLSIAGASRAGRGEQPVESRRYEANIRLNSFRYFKFRKAFDVEVRLNKIKMMSTPTEVITTNNVDGLYSLFAMAPSEARRWLLDHRHEELMCK